MYFDTRLWGYTQGVRLRIFGAVAIGILAVLFGIARLALLGWLIARIFRARPWKRCCGLSPVLLSS